MLAIRFKRSQVKSCDRGICKGCTVCMGMFFIMFELGF